MDLSGLALLSEPQNLLFVSRFHHALKELGAKATKADHPSEADVVYLCGLPATELLESHRPLLAPVLDTPRYQGQPWYFVDVIARNPETALGSGRWAYNETASFSGWVAARHGLRGQHLDPDELDWIFTGSHAASLQAVRQGRADLAGIDSMITDLAPELFIDLVVLDHWGPWPTPPVMVARKLDAGVVGDLEAALLGTDGEVLWVPIGPDHLDPIAAMRSSSTGM
jgi:phosphonate transport system substrate-binding protein